jgi:hypothetical protein
MLEPDGKIELGAVGIPSTKQSTEPVVNLKDTWLKSVIGKVRPRLLF